MFSDSFERVIIVFHDIFTFSSVKLVCLFITGITIVGGEDSNRLGSGIFIKNIIAGGLAAKDGRLQKGDNKTECYLRL